MALNLISPSSFTTGYLIGNTSSSSAGNDTLPSLTKVDGVPVDAALELQSNDSALLCTRLTQLTLDKMLSFDGMVVYNKDTQRFNFREGGKWEAAGNIIGPATSIRGDIAVFADETGKLLADSGVNINIGEPPAALNVEADDVFLRMSNLSEISFASAENAITIDDRIVSIISLSDLTFEPKTIFTDSTFIPTEDTPNVLFELNSTHATFLNARMTSPQVSAMAPEDGMQVYDKTLGAMLFRQNGQWTPITAGGGGGAPNTATYIIGALNPLLPNAQSLSQLNTGILKNTTLDLEGKLSIAQAGLDYYSPGNPTTIIDTGNTDSKNFLIGTRVGIDSLTGSNNIGIGIDNLTSIGGSSGNISIGINTATSVIEGGGSVIVGIGSLTLATEPVNTVVIGNVAAISQTLYDSCVFVGTGTDALNDNLQNAIAIGADAKVSTSNTLVLGNNTNVTIGGTDAPYNLNLKTINGQAALYIDSNDDKPTIPGSGGGVLYVKPGEISGYDLFFNDEKLTSGFAEGVLKFILGLFSASGVVLGSASPFVPFAQSLGSLGPLNTNGLLKNTIGPNLIPGFPDKGTLSQAVPVKLGDEDGDYYAPGFPIYIKTTTPIETANLFIGDKSVGYTGPSATSVNNTVVGIGSYTKAKDGTGQGNTMLGTGTGKVLEYGSYNTAVGSGAFFAAVGSITGSSNGTTAIGTNSAISQARYTNCTFLGYNADALVDNLSNATAIGYQAKVGASNVLVLGKDANVTIGKNNAAYTLELGNVPSAVQDNALMCTIAFDNTQTAPTIPDAGEGGQLYVYEDNLYYNGLPVSFGGVRGQPNNFFIGETAGNNELPGTGNVAAGLMVGTFLDDASRNTIYGNLCLNKLQSGESNIAIGSNVMQQAVDVSDNVAIGDGTLGAGTELSENVAIGAFAGSEFAKYTQCLFIGYDTDATVDDLSNAIAIGADATVSASNTFVLGRQCSVIIGGKLARYAFDIAVVGQDAAANAAIGMFNSPAIPAVPDPGEGGVLYVRNDLLYFNGNQISNSIHGEPGNLFVGSTVGYPEVTITGDDNVGVGLELFNNLTSGTDNVALGYQSLVLIENGRYNIGIGSDAASSLVNGSRNLAAGNLALANIVGANNNVALGDGSLETLVGNTSDGNTAIGVNAGKASIDEISLIGCTFLGANTKPDGNNLINATAIGYGATVLKSNSIVLGKDANVGINIFPDYTLELGNVHNTVDGTLMCVLSFENTEFEPPVPGLGEGGRLYVLDDLLYFNGEPVGVGGESAPVDAAYILATFPDPNPFTNPNAQSLGALTSGVLKNVVTDGVGQLTQAVPVPKNSDTGDYYAPGYPVHIITDTLLSVPPLSNLMIMPDAPVNYATGVFRGSFNTIFGSGAYYLATEGTKNCAFGGSTLAVALTASHNSVFGEEAGSGITVGSFNTLIGTSSGKALTTGLFNTGVGNGTLLGQVITADNTAVGYNAGSALVPSFLRCTFVGSGTNSSSSDFTALSKVENSIALGYKAVVGTGVVSGATVRGAISIGSEASVSADNSITLGTLSAVTATNSLAFGASSNVSGSSSLAAGFTSSITANNAVALGSNSTVSGVGAIGLGFTTNVTGANSIAFGANSSVTADNSIAIGANLTVSQEKTIVLGNNYLAGIGNPNPAYGLHIGTHAVNFQAYIGIEQNPSAIAPADPETAVVLYNGNGPTDKDFFCVTPTRTVNLTNNDAAFVLWKSEGQDNSPVMPNQKVINLADAPGYVYYDNDGDKFELKNPSTDYAPKSARYIVYDDTDKPDNAQVLKELVDPVDPFQNRMLKVQTDGKIELAKAGTDYETPGEVDAKIDAAKTEIGLSTDAKIATAVAGIEVELGVLEEEIGDVAITAGGAAVTAAAALTAATAAAGEIAHLETETYILRTDSSTLSNATSLYHVLSNSTSPTGGYLYITPLGSDDVNVDITAGTGGGGGDSTATYLLVSPDVTLPNSVPLSSLGTSGYVYYDSGVVSLGDPTVGPGGAPNNADYIIGTANTSLASAQVLGSLGNGMLKNSVTASTGTLELAIGGTDYYGPGGPTYIVDTHDSTYNLFVGTNIGNPASTTYTNNTVFGRNALAVISGISSSNVVLGTNCLTLLEDGSRNIAIGYEALPGIQSPSSDNIGIGYQTFLSAITSSGSIALGNYAGTSQNEYTDCIFIGRGADAAFDSLTNAVAIGNNSSVNTSNTISLGNNCYVGFGTPVALYSATFANVTGPNADLSCVLSLENTDTVPTQPDQPIGGIIYVTENELYFSSVEGTVNISAPGDFGNFTYIVQESNIGLPNAQSLGDLTTGLVKNTVSSGIGVLSTALPVMPGSPTGEYYGPGLPTYIFDSGTNAPYNLFIGWTDIADARPMATGTVNIGIGINALKRLELGQENTAVGGDSMSATINGTRNSAYGRLTLYQAVDSSENTAVGALAGYGQNQYTQCTFLGFAADATVPGLINATAIGYGAQVSGNNCVVIGANANVGMGTSLPQSKLHVVGDIRQKGIVANFPGTEVIKSQAGTATDNAIPQSILSISVPTDVGGSMSVRMSLTAINDAGTACANGTLDSGALYNSSGSLIVGPTNFTMNTTAGFTVDAYISGSLGSVNVSVVGIDSQAIIWVLTYEYFSARNVIV